MLEPRMWLPRSRAPARPWGWGGLLRWLWTLPTTALGHLAGRVLSGQPPTRVRGPAASAALYPIPPRMGLSWVGAVTLGHVILHRPGLFDGSVGRLILAHELAHTRQHDWLGPLYLPLHIIAQLASATLSVGGTVRHSRVHDNNPLEQTFICLGASAYGPLARGERIAGAPPGCDARAMLTAFGLADAIIEPASDSDSDISDSDINA